MGAVELDQLFLNLGINGFYPLGYWLMLWLVTGMNMVLFMGNAMVSFPVKFDCLSNVTIGNRTTEEVCSTCPTNSRWIYELPKAHSLVATFDLVCSESHRLSFVDTFFFIGCFMGSTVMGPLSDRFGRRWVLLASTACVCPLGVVTFFVNSIEFYVALRFTQGLVFAGLVSTSTFKAELFPSKYRYLPLTCDFSWVLVNPFFPLFAYLIPNWRHLQGVLLSMSVLLLPTFYMLPESVPWLIRKGRRKEAYDILSKVAANCGVKINRADLFERVTRESTGPDVSRMGSATDSFLKSALDGAVSSKADSLVDYETAERKKSWIARLGSQTETVAGKGGTDEEIPVTDNPMVSFWEALKFPPFFWSLMLTGSQWAYANLIYIVISFSYGSFGGHRLIMYLLLCLADLPGKFVSVPIVYYFNRRFSLLFFGWLTAVPLLAIGFSRLAIDDVDAELPGFRIAMCMISRIGIWILFESSQIFSQESIPTLLRARSYLIAFMFAGVASASASYIAFFMSTHAIIIELSLGVAGFCISCLALAVPETRGEPLPQTLNDLLAMRKTTGNIFHFRSRKKI